MNTKLVTPNAEHRAFRTALEVTIAEHGKTVDAIELLAILSHLVGQVIALQDQRKYTPSMVMSLVSSNIEQGNRDVIDDLLLKTGGHA